MIDEQELYDLARGASPTTCRSVEAVLARGRRLHQRRRAGRAAGLTAIVGGVVATGTLVLHRGADSDQPEIEAAGESTTTPQTATTTSVDVPVTCDIPEESIITPTPVPPADMPDGLRLLPNWLPEGASISLSHGETLDSVCTPSTTGPAMELWALGGDNVVDATISVSGPAPSFGFGSGGVSRALTQLRGQEAALVHLNSFDLAFEWTDAEGSSWQVWGRAVDEATLRAVAEALQLDGTPGAGDPVASLPNGAALAGFEVAWQAPGVPEASIDPALTWVVNVGDRTAGQQSDITCALRFTQLSPGHPFPASHAYPGSVLISLGDRQAVWNGAAELQLMSSLAWQATPDVIGSVECATGGMEPIGLETVTQIAESVVPVAADDDRLRPD